MTDRKKKLTKWLIGIAATCILIFLGVQNIDAVAGAVSWFFGIISPLIIGLAIALIVNVPMSFLERHFWPKAQKRFWCGLRRPVAFLLSLIFILGILAGVAVIVVPEVINAITVIVEAVTEMVTSFSAMSDEEILKLPLGQMLLGINWDSLLESLQSWLTNRADIIVDTLFGTIRSIVGAVFDLFVSIVFAGCILFGKENLRRQSKRIIHAWFPKKFGGWFVHAASIINTNFKNFVIGQSIEGVILGVICLIGMLIFQFPYAAMISTLIGVTALIPVVGALVGGGVGAFMILTVDPIKAFFFVVYLVVLQQLEGNLIYPRVMGSRVKLPGMWILAAVTVGGGIGGVVGMLLSVPFASTAYTLFREETKKKELRHAPSAAPLAETEVPEVAAEEVTEAPEAEEVTEAPVAEEAESSESPEVAPAPEAPVAPATPEPVAVPETTEPPEFPEAPLPETHE